MRLDNFPQKRVEIITGTEGFRLINGQIVSPRTKTIVMVTTREILGALKKGIIINEVLDNGTKIRLNLQNYKTDYNTAPDLPATKKDTVTTKSTAAQTKDVATASEDKKETVVQSGKATYTKYKTTNNNTADPIDVIDKDSTTKK